MQLRVSLTLHFTQRVTRNVGNPSTTYVTIRERLQASNGAISNVTVSMQFVAIGLYEHPKQAV